MQSISSNKLLPSTNCLGMHTAQCTLYGKQYAHSQRYEHSVSSTLNCINMKTPAYQLDLVRRKSFIDSLVWINFIHFTLQYTLSYRLLTSATTYKSVCGEWLLQDRIDIIDVRFLWWCANNGQHISYFVRCYQRNQKRPQSICLVTPFSNTFLEQLINSISRWIEHTEKQGVKFHFCSS